MLNFSFFIAAFSSIFWFIFSLRYINLTAVLSGNNAEALYQAVMIMLFPIALIWGIFAIIKGLYAERLSLLRLNTVLDTIHKNTESTAGLYTLLLGAEAELKNGFIINEFDILISDTNEVLADIIKRSNSISSTQMEHLWTRTAGGERWLIAKTFIETHNFQSGFMNHLLQKAQKDNLLKGSILEFQTRYQGLRALLEKNDKQQLFYNMVEYGAMGKVYSLLNPIAQKLLDKRVSTADVENPTPEFTQTEEPLAFPSFLNNETDSSLFRQPVSTDFKAVKNPEDSINLKERLAEPTLSTNTPDIPPAPRISEFNTPHLTTTGTKTQTKKASAPLISLDELEKEINASPENNYDEYAYPFGVWTNDKNNK